MDKLLGDFLSNSGLQSTIAPILADPSVEKFNNVLLEFLTKFKRVAKLDQKEVSKVDKILNLAKENSPLPKTLFQSVLNDTIKDKILHADKSLFKAFPFLPMRCYEDLSAKTQKSTWKYLKKLVRVTENNQVASTAVEELSEKIPAMLASIDWDNFGDIMYMMLGKVKKVMGKHGINKKNTKDFVVDIMEVVPQMGDIDPKEHTKLVLKGVNKLFFD